MAEPTQKQLYDQLYHEGKELFADNPCNLHKDAEGKVRCLGGSPCCSGCQHLGDGGCTVMALACKLWTCSSLRKAHPELDSKLQVIAGKAVSASIPLYIRASREETFRRLY